MKEQRAPAVPQKHLHSRISFLFQAATYLSEVGNSGPTNGSTGPTNDELSAAAIKDEHLLRATERASQEKGEVIPMQTTRSDPRLEDDILNSSFSKALGPSRHFLSHLRAVSLKGQIRLTPAVKHAICKRCNTLLVPGSTSTSNVENKSRGGRKAWADVLVVTCKSCGSVRRFPIGATRQQRRTKRFEHKI